MREFKILDINLNYCTKQLIENKINMSKIISDSRKQQLEELKNFTDEVNKEITNIVGALGWTMESTMANIVSIIKLLS